MGVENIRLADGDLAKQKRNLNQYILKNFTGISDKVRKVYSGETQRVQKAIDEFERAEPNKKRQDPDIRLQERAPKDYMTDYQDLYSQINNYVVENNPREKKFLKGLHIPQRRPNYFEEAKVPEYQESVHSTSTDKHGSSQPDYQGRGSEGLTRPFTTENPQYTEGPYQFVNQTDPMPTDQDRNDVLRRFNDKNVENRNIEPIVEEEKPAPEIKDDFQFGVSEDQDDNDMWKELEMEKLDQRKDKNSGFWPNDED